MAQQLVTEQRCKHWWPGWPPLRDFVTNLMGLLILIYAGAVLWGPLTSVTLDGVQRAQAIASMLGPILGTVLGFYFGSATGAQAAQVAANQVEQTIEAKEDTKASSDMRLEEMLEVAQQFKDVLTYVLSDRDNNSDQVEEGEDASQEIDRSSQAAQAAQDE